MQTLVTWILDRNPYSVLGALIVLLLLDAITTVVGLHQGLVETNPHVLRLFDTYGAHLAIAIVTIGKLALVVALDVISKQLPYDHGYRLITYSGLALVHVDVVVSNLALLL